MSDNKYYELLGRINEMEERIALLEENKTKVEEENIGMKINKNEFIKNVIEIINEKLDVENYILKKATPKNGEGNGIFMKSKINKSMDKRIMMRKSKDYSDTYTNVNDYAFSGWFTVEKSELKEYDAHVFMVYYDSSVTYFVFNKEEIEEILKSKNVDSYDRYHFYLAQDNFGDYIDHRDNKIDLNKYVNAWENIEQIL